jgi:PAS domain S-box-containing protein
MTGNSSTVPEAPGPTPDVEPGERTRRSAGDGASEVVLLLDPQGRVLSVGTGATLPGGHGPADLVGRHVSVLYPSEDAASGGAARALDAAAGLGTHRECAWRVRPDGVRFWAETVITATRDAHARLAGYCVAVHDLTARWRHESRQRAVAEVTQSVVECRPGPEVLALAARRVRESVGAETAGR